MSAAISLRWLWYLMAFFIPFAGILTALFLYDQDPREVRKVGRNCLLIGFLIWVLLPTLIFMAVMAALVLGIISLAADMMSPTD